jgi:type IV pilus assembly protein PilQ
LISLDFKDADVQNILRILAAESGKNIVAGEDVKGKLTISLRNVPWELALETVLESQGLQKLEKGNVLRIVSTERLIKEQEAKAKADETKIKSESESRTKKAEAELKEVEALTKRQAAVLAAEEAKARGPLREETIRLAYADAEETTKTLIGILGLPESGTQAPQAPTPGSLGAAPPFSALFGPPGTPQPPPVPVSEVLAKGITIRAHKPTNSIFIRHYEADVERIKKLVKEKLDIQLPQVQIEARMEIVDRSALEQLGIQWGGGLAAKGDSTALFATGSSALTGTGTQAVNVNSKNPNFLPSTNTALPISPTTGLPTGGNLINLPVSLLATSANPAAGLIFGLVGNRFNINLALQALETLGKTKTLAQPQIVTVENAKATMSLGEEIPYATVSSAGTQIQFKEALLKLEVTPSVIQEGSVTKVKMKIVVENNARGDTVNLGSSAGSPPAIAKRKAETEVLVVEGDRLVIGGVINETDTTQIRQVPFLGSIPGLGWLFKSREINNTGRELIVIITPTVLKSKGS